MNFSTPVELPSDLPRFTQADELLLMGSCFATNIGALLADARFRLDVNPFGVLYNPFVRFGCLARAGNGQAV